MEAFVIGEAGWMRAAAGCEGDERADEGVMRAVAQLRMDVKVAEIILGECNEVDGGLWVRGW